MQPQTITRPRRPRCPRCKLDMIPGTLPHDRPEDCISALSKRLTLAVSENKRLVARATRLQADHQRMKRRQVTSVVARLEALEDSHSNLRQGYMEMRGKFLLLMGELRKGRAE